MTPGGPFGSFIQAVRSRKPEDNNANAEVAHYSAALCHLANISYRLGTASMPYNKAGAALGDNKQVVEIVRQHPRQPEGDRREAGGDRLPSGPAA